MLGVGIIAVFAGLRYLIYAEMPASTFVDWAVRDTVMNGPRLLALGLALFLGLRVWDPKALGFHARGARAALFVFVSFFGVLWLPDHWLRSQENALGAATVWVLAGSSVLVGLWEEILFRGVLLNAIRDWKGTRAAIVGSSFLFTIMHVQAQPLASWPALLLAGLVFAALRVQGVGLWWLVAGHAAFDTLVLMGPMGPESFPGLSVCLLLLRCLFVVRYLSSVLREGGERQWTNAYAWQ
jgi:membrane protease YdiL (CAAX protease family)